VEKNNISILPLDPALPELAFDLICHAFVRNSVLHRALQITTKEYRDYAAPWFELIVQQGFSIVAVDNNTQQVAGCLLACDYANQVSNPSVVPEKFRPLSALLARLDYLYCEGNKPAFGEQLLIDIAVVDPDFEGRGVYTQLRRYVQHMARSAGFRLVVGELSSAATQSVCVNKFGHRVCAEVEYSQFEFEGELPFASIDDPSGIQLVVGEL
jgi:GNAT superfamily N-acetyltransferase